MTSPTTPIVAPPRPARIAGRPVATLPVAPSAIARRPDSTVATAFTDADFHRLQAYVHAETGIRFAPTKRYFVDKRVQACIRESGLRDFASWFTELRLGRGDLRQRLVNQLTVNETYFLREDYQFDALVESVLPRVLAARRAAGDHGPIRIWSMPSSTGEEPYSVAITLLERWPAIATVDVEIVGADIDTNALAHARAGEFSARAVHRVPPALLGRYFTPLPGGRYRIVDDLRGAIDFRHVNINDSAQMRAQGRFDVVLCRNLLIYFDDLSRRRAADHLYGALRPGGFLFLGHSETMSRVSSVFVPRRLPQGIAYQRPAEGQP